MITLISSGDYHHQRSFLCQWPNGQMIAGILLFGLFSEIATLRCHAAMPHYGATLWCTHYDATWYHTAAPHYDATLRCHTAVPNVATCVSLSCHFALSDCRLNGSLAVPLSDPTMLQISHLISVTGTTDCGTPLLTVQNMWCCLFCCDLRIVSMENKYQVCCICRNASYFVML